MFQQQGPGRGEPQSPGQLVGTRPKLRRAERREREEREGRERGGLGGTGAETRTLTAPQLVCFLVFSGVSLEHKACETCPGGARCEADSQVGR